MRLDALLVCKYPQYSRSQIQEWIAQGRVCVDGKVITKSGTYVSQDVHLECDFEKPRYVSRSGYKLEKALQAFNLDVTGFVCLDAGVSTGGFTDCLLQHGAKKVYGIEVGHGQTAVPIAQDKRVVLFERTNIRDITFDLIGELVDLVTLDLSFISVLKIIDVLIPCMKNDAYLIVLVKPQFETHRGNIRRGGLVKDPGVHKEVLARVTQGIEEYGFSLVGVIDSPIYGGSGNKEFLASFRR